MSDATPPEDLLILTAEIVAAQVANSEVAMADLPGLISTVHQALAGLGQEQEPEAAPKLNRPIGVRASIKPDGLVSMIDGRTYQTLKRHLGTHGHTPESYRRAYDLPADYPMVSPAYAEKRRTLAKALGLGRKPAAKASAPTKQGGVRKTLKAALGAAKSHLGGE